MIRVNAITRRWIFISVLLIGLYAFTRLTNLTKLPIFTDEAIYIRWSQIGSRDANWRFISLTDGKQPLYTWIAMLLLRVIPGDPLFIGRLVSVCAGFATLIGVWFLSYAMFRSIPISFLTGFMYIVSPFTLMYDRMALYDSLVATFSVWSLYLSVLLVRTLRLDIALILGLVLGFGMLNKSSGFISLYLLPITLLLVLGKNPGRKKLFSWLGLALVAAVVSQGIYSILRLSPFFYMIGQKDAVFIYPFSEWLRHPFLFFEGNLRGLFDWLWRYLTLPVFLIGIVSAMVRTRFDREKVLLYLWWIIPFVGLALFGRVLYPRFVLFMGIPLLVIASVAIVRLWQSMGKTAGRIIASVVIFFPSVITSFYIITQPVHAPIPQADKGQYIDDWPSGGGVSQINTYLLAQSKSGKVSVFTEGTFGLMPYAVEIYLVEEKNIDIHGIWPLPEIIPSEIRAAAEDHPTFVILNETQTTPAWPLSEVARYQKGNRKDRVLRLFRVTTGEENQSV